MSKLLEQAKKYTHAGFGVLPVEYDHMVVSRENKEKARRIVKIVVAKKSRRFSSYTFPSKRYQRQHN